MLRAVEGFVASGVGSSEVPAAFQRADLLIYSPLCLALGLATAVVAWTGGRADRARAPHRRARVA